MNKKGITGTIIGLFVSTIVIIIILLGFFLASFFVKISHDASSAGAVNKDISYTLDLKKSHSYLYNSLLLESMLNYKSEFNGETRSLYEVLGLWDETNTQEIIKFISQSNLRIHARFFNSAINKQIKCDWVFGSVGISCAESIEDFASEYTDGNNKIKFQAVPFKIKIILYGERENEI
ncbi:hypothetical protein FJZ19_05395 [Candidatus Pacearchaeota archaeon]|nr:hypothetical protein [Candidatus Pacearchaeota archaeon]